MFVSKTIRLIILIVAVRLSSVFITKTYYVPDEYWQSLEVAHKLVFGYGYLTWEWREGIRSYLYPILIAALYKLLDIFNLDTVFTLTVLPRIFQALLTSYGDFCIIRRFNYSKWTILIFLSNWFVFYIGSRTLLNSVEYSLCMIALSKFPSNPNKAQENDTSFLWVVALSCMIRPTAIIPWIPLCLYHVKYSKYGASNLIFYRYLPIGIIAVTFVVIIDSIFHGSLIFTPFQFLKFNILYGIGSFYGSNPFHYYITLGLPTLIGFNVVPLIAAGHTIYKKGDPFLYSLALSILLTVCVLSVIDHKEFRFLLSVLPMILLLISQKLAEWSRTFSTTTLVIIGGVIILANSMTALFLGVAHQRGNLDVMSELVNVTNSYEKFHDESPKVLFLMPCHSTPYYSHIHKNIELRFLTCDPDVYQKGLTDEADRFYENPAEWVDQNYPNVPVDNVKDNNKNNTCTDNCDERISTENVWQKVNLPSHIVCFDLLGKQVEDLFPNYTKIKTLFSSVITSDSRVGNEILIYEKNI